MVFNSPCLTDKKELIHHEVEMVINSPWIMPLLGTKGLASPEQTATVGLFNKATKTANYMVLEGVLMKNKDAASSRDIQLICAEFFQVSIKTQADWMYVVPTVVVPTADEMSSPEHISPLPAISPFLCTDSSEAPDSSDGPPSQDPHVMHVARWRIKVASRPSSSSEFPIAHVTAMLGIRRRSAILIRPGEAISFGRPYRTHLNGLRKLLTARKRVGPLPAHRLAWRRASPRSLDHCPSSSNSSLDSFQAFLRWCAAPLSTVYPPTTSESSSGDSPERPLHSSSHSAGPSRKRCRSPVDSIPSSTLVTGSLAPTRADLLPPRKGFRDSYSSKANIEEDTEVDPIEAEVDMELGISDGDDVRNHVEIDPRDVRDDT
ncbi:hypothetical protein Tco_0272830 [Tanacetum coccineum]